MNQAGKSRSTAMTDSPGHELSDVNPAWVAVLAAVLLCVSLAVVGISLAIFWHFETTADLRIPAANPMTPSPSFAEPRLQAEPAKDLQTMRSEEAALLSRYGWIDKSRGIVRIPIERAMALLAERGLPETTTPWVQDAPEEHSP